MDALVLKSRYGLLRVSPLVGAVHPTYSTTCQRRAEYPASLLVPIGGPVDRLAALRVIRERVRGEGVANG